MLECKPMNTPMEAKLKLLVDTSSKLIDATLLSTRLHKLDFLKSRRKMSKQCSYMQNSVIQQALKRPRFPYFHFVISVLSMRECKRLLATLDLGVGTYSGVFFTC
jgi:hypothetical protein